MGIINLLKLPDITKEKIKKNKWKKEVKMAIIEQNKIELKEEIDKLKKVKEFKNEQFEQKDYFKNLSLKEAREIFKHRAKMTEHVKRNYQNEPKYRYDLWKCNSCRSNIDTQSHILWCEAYKNLRENKNLHNDKDLATYILEVLEIRTKLCINK